MILLEWSADKNALLKQERDVSFEEVELALIEGRVLDDLSHPNVDKFPHQRLLVFELDDYAYVVPYVFKDENTLFLKTIYPSREFTKQYLREQK